MDGEVHVVLVSAHQSQWAARSALPPEVAACIPYRGVWIHPTRDQVKVHVFSESTLQEIEWAGWTRVPDE